MLKNTATTVYYTVYNTSTGAVVTGDVSNHTAKISKDGGTLTTCANSPTELGNGTYKITLTATECNCSTAQLVVVSSTTDTHIPPVLLAFEAAPSIPTAAQNASAVWASSVRTLTESPTDLSAITAALAIITALLGRWTLIADILTIYDTDGTTALKTYTLTRGTDGNITSITEAA